MKKRTVIISVIMIIMASLSIAFAVLSTSLNINGSGGVEASTWDIHFANLGTIQKSATTLEINPPHLLATRIADFEVQFSNAGDYMSYSFDVVNGGNIDAKIGSISIPTPLCTGSGNNANTDATNVCSYLTYTLKYTGTSTTPTVGNVLSAGQTQSLTLTLTYSSSAPSSSFPLDDVTITNLGIVLTYVQT